MKQVLSIHCSSVDEWRENRKKFIGGSDIAGVLGASPWATPFSVWCSKFGFEKKDTKSMKYGREMESELRETLQGIIGEKIQTSNEIYYRGVHSASLDGFTESAGIEIKTTSDPEWWKVPIYYQYQIQQYMYVCGFDRFIVYAKGRGWDSLFEIERNQQMIDEIIKAGAKFWTYVEKKEPPTADLSKKIDREASIWARNNKISVNYYGACTVDDFLFVKNEIKRLKEVEQKFKFMLYLNDKLEEKEIKYTVFDAEKFKEDHPDLFEKYKKETMRVRFDVKASKGADCAEK